MSLPVDPPLCAEPVDPKRVSLGREPFLHHLRSALAGFPVDGALFGSFLGTTLSSDYPVAYMTGVRPQPFPSGLLG